ncbi:MAG: tetratricopeptide repeat protein [Deltaproteobacteria bacterium]|nr:tetratricopeptide repeat protein [Deltaproteobacteria bacterium]
MASSKDTTMPFSDPSVSEGFTFVAVASITGIPESKLRYWAQTGFVGPSIRRGTRQLYSFRDLVCVKAAGELVDRGFKTTQIREALTVAQTSLPSIDGSREALLRLRVAFNGVSLVVLDEGAAYEVTGQRVFDFGLAELADQASAAMDATPLAVKSPKVESGRLCAYDWFVEGLSLEGQSGREDEAIACYRQALAADPGLAAAHTNLGGLAYRRGDREAARAAFEKSLALDPEQSEARFNLGNLMLEDGDMDLAAAEYRRVLTTNPHFADAHYNLATALEALGSKAQARQHLSEYLRLCQPKGDDPWVLEARERLEKLR